MKILGISDVHNDLENTFRYIDVIEKLNVDVIVFCGDILDSTLPKGFRAIDIAALFIEQLSLLKKPILVVPGNFDKEILEFINEKKISLHGRGIIINDVGFFGYGGAKTPFNTSLEPEEGELKLGLYKSYMNVKDAKYKVQVTHAPPFNTSVDLLYTGFHVGSKAIREFIEEVKPNVAFCGHIQEAKGIDYIENTTVINCGRFSEGYCGLVEIKEGKVFPKIINLNLEEEILATSSR